MRRATMGILDDQTKLRETILLFDKKIDRMHAEFDKYRKGETYRIPDLEHLERDLLSFSRRKPYSLELSNQLDRILYKLQARKRLWLRWVDEFHQGR